MTYILLQVIAYLMIISWILHTAVFRVGKNEHLHIASLLFSIGILGILWGVSAIYYYIHERLTILLLLGVLMIILMPFMIRTAFDIALAGKKLKEN